MELGKGVKFSGRILTEKVVKNGSLLGKWGVDKYVSDPTGRLKLINQLILINQIN